MAKQLHTEDCCVVRGEIRYCSAHHLYTHIPSNRRLTSVSTIVNRVYNAKSWDGVDPAIIENAARRGSAVDFHMAQYVQTRHIVIEYEADDVAERLLIAHRIWEAQFGGRKAQAQRTVFSLEDGVAGTMDFDIEPAIVGDLKCTYSVESSWVLQLGAYGEYADAERGGILHVSPNSKLYPEGGRWLEYDMDICRSYWRKAVAWWKETQEMEKFGRQYGK